MSKHLWLVGGVAGLIAVLVGGIQMVMLESVAGNTIDEAFYNYMGWVAIGTALIVLAVGISLSVLLGRVFEQNRQLIELSKLASTRTGDVLPPL